MLIITSCSNYSREELEILNHIQEGISDTHQLKVFTNLSLDNINKIMKKLEELGLIKISKKYDKTYKEDFWDSVITEKAKEFL